MNSPEKSQSTVNGIFGQIGIHFYTNTNTTLHTHTHTHKLHRHDAISLLFLYIFMAVKNGFQHSS